MKNFLYSLIVILMLFLAAFDIADLMLAMFDVVIETIKSF